MSALLKKCFYCRSDLPETNGSINAVQCDKCKKNEEKYGKPITCKYCQLPAAFRDEKCVYCSHSERKFGAPTACASCKLKAAFQRENNSTKPVLCRMCICQARSNKQTVVAGVPVPAHDRVPSHTKDKGNKRKKESITSDAPVSKVPKPIDTGEHVLQLQQLKDKIMELQLLVQKRDTQIQEKDKKIAALQADLKSAERKQKEKFQQMLKEKEEAVNAVHQKYRQEKQNSIKK